MATNNTWPVFLKAEIDPATGSTVGRFKGQVGDGLRDIGVAGAAAGKKIDDGFRFDGARARLNAFAKEMRDTLAKASATGPFSPTAPGAQRDPFAVRNSLGARSAAASGAFISARVAGQSAADATEAANRAVGRLNENYAVVAGKARAAGGAAIAFGGSARNAFSVAAGAAGVFQGALGGIASRLGFLGQLFTTIGAKGALAIGLLAGGGALIGAGAQLQNYQNLLRSTTASQQEFAEAQEATARIAAASRTSLSDTIQSYAKLKINSQELGLTNKDLEKTLIAVQQAIQLSGSNAQETSAAMLQFGQALASNKLSGDEFRSLGENATKVLQSIRKGLEITGEVKGFDGTIASFRKLSTEGELTGGRVARAMLAMGQTINNQFQAMPVTIGQATTKLQNAFLQIGLSVENTLHPLQGTANAMNALAGNMGVLGSAAGGVATAFAVALLPRLALAVGACASNVAAFISLARTTSLAGTAAAQMAGTTGAVRAAMAALLTPVGLAAVAIGALAAAAIYFASQGSVAARAADLIGVSLDELTGRANRTAGALRDASFAARELAGVQARQKAVEAGQLTIEGRANALASARNARLYAGGPLTKTGRALGSAIEKFEKGGTSDQLLRDAKAAGVAGIAYQQLTKAVSDYQATSRAFHIAESQRLDTLRETSPQAKPRADGTANIAKTKAQLNAEAKALANTGDTLIAARARYQLAVKNLEAEYSGKGGKIPADKQSDYLARRLAVEQAYKGEVDAIKAGAAASRSAKSAAAKEAREAAAAARKHLINEGQQALADGKVLGSASDELAAAQARYAAAITAIRNKQQEGTISNADAKAAAAAAQADLLNAKASIEALEKLQTAFASIQSDFDGEPKFVDKIQKARENLDKLDKLIADSGIGRVQFKDGTIVTEEDAARSRKNVEDGLIKPITDAKKAMQDAAAVQDLILHGREGEAEFLEKANALLEQYGNLQGEDLVRVKGQLADLRKLTDEEFKRNRAIEARNKQINAAVQAAENLQDALTGVLTEPFKAESYKTLFSTFLGDFKKQLFEGFSQKLFGNLGQQVDDAFRRQKDPLGVAGEKLEDSAIDQHNAAVDLVKAADQLSNAASSLGGQAGPTVGQVATTPGSYGIGALGQVGNAIGGPIGSFIDVLSPILGQLSGKTGGVAPASGGVEAAVRQTAAAAVETTKLIKSDPLRIDPVNAYNQFGAAVGKKIDGTLGTGSVFSKIGGKLGDALQGLAIGQQTGQLPGLFGLKTSQLGASIGGALGGAIAGPIGGAIGGFLGSIVGGLFTKSNTKKGHATIGGDEYGNLDVVDTGGGSAQRRRAASESSNAVIDALEGLASQLGVELNAALGHVTIGVRGEDYTVDPTGTGQTKSAVSFGKDEKLAIEFAIKDLINDGVLVGIRAGTKKLLTESRSIAKGIEKAMKFENVFRDLKRFTDPVGAAIDELDFKFNELRRIFAEAGASAAEYSDLEKLYAFERADAIKSAAKDVASTLEDLLKDLTYSGDTGLSLRTRQTNAFGAFNPLRAQIEAGQPVDQQDFADAARALLDIQRQIYGSTSAYFDSLTLITALTKRAITNAGGTVAPSVPVAPGQPAQGVVPGGAYQGVQPPLAPGSLGGVQAPGVPADVAAANDNYASASRIIASIGEQTTTLKTSIDAQLPVLNSIRGAIERMSAGTRSADSAVGSASGGFTAGRTSTLFDQATVAAVNSGNAAVVGVLEDIAESTSQVAANSFSRAAPVTVGGLDVQQPWWTAPNAGSAFGTGSGAFGISAFG